MMSMTTPLFVRLRTRFLASLLVLLLGGFGAVSLSAQDADTDPGVGEVGSDGLSDEERARRDAARLAREARERRERDRESREAAEFDLGEFSTVANENSWTPQSAITGSPLAVPIEKQAMSLEIFTAAHIDAVGADDIKDILRFSAGIDIDQLNVQPGENTTATDNPIRLRGILNEGTLRNGFYHTAQTDAINFAQVDIARGPQALLYGIGAFGGVVNVMTKTPIRSEGGWEDRVTVGAEVGSYNYRRGTIDMAGGATSWLGYRFMVAYTEQESWIDYDYRDKLFISPALQFQFFDDRLTIDMSFEHIDTYQTNESGGYTLTDTNLRYANRQFAPDFDFGFVAIPNFGFRWVGDDAFTDGRDYLYDANVNWKLSDELTFIFQYYHNVKTRESTDARVSVADPGTNVPRSLVPWLNPLSDPALVRWDDDAETRVDESSLRVTWAQGMSEQIRHQFRTELRYYYEHERWGEHTLIAGQTFNTFKLQQDGRSWQAPREGPGSELTTYPTYQSLRDFSEVRFPGDVPGGIWNDTSAGYTRSTFWEWGYYVVLQSFMFDERFNTMMGLRYDLTNNKSESRVGTENYRQRHRIYGPSEKWSPSFQLSYEILDGVSIYGRTATGLKPIYNQQLWTGEDPEPIEGDSAEAGLKWSFDLENDAIFSGELAVYHQTRQNIIRFDQGPIANPNLDPDLPRSGVNFQAGDESEGFELRFNLIDFVENLNLRFSYAYTTVFLSDIQVPNAEEVGFGFFPSTVQAIFAAAALDTPEHSVTLITQYTFPDDHLLGGLSSTFSATYQTARLESGPGNFPTQDFDERFTGQLNFAYKREVSFLNDAEVSFRFSVRNLFNDVGPFGYTIVSPRTYRGGITVNF